LYAVGSQQQPSAALRPAAAECQLKLLELHAITKHVSNILMCQFSSANCKLRPDSVRQVKIMHYGLSKGTFIDRLSVRHRYVSKLLPTLIPLSGVGTTCFPSSCDKDSTIIFTTGRKPVVNPP
jgi:hypothetical protein